MAWHRGLDSAHLPRLLGIAPSLRSFVCTSAKLTVLLVASFRSSGVSLSAPGSLLRTASKADASSTTLFTASSLTTASNQFIDQRPARFHVLANATSRLLQTMFECCNTHSSFSRRKNTSSPALMSNALRNDAGITTRPFSLTRIRVSALIVIFYHI